MGLLWKHHLIPVLIFELLRSGIAFSITPAECLRLQLAGIQQHEPSIANRVRFEVIRPLPGWAPTARETALAEAALEKAAEVYVKRGLLSEADARRVIFDGADELFSNSNHIIGIHDFEPFDSKGVDWADPKTRSALKDKIFAYGRIVFKRKEGRNGISSTWLPVERDAGREIPELLHGVDNVAELSRAILDPAVPAQYRFQYYQLLSSETEQEINRGRISTRFRVIAASHTDKHTSYWEPTLALKPSGTRVQLNYGGTAEIIQSTPQEMKNRQNQRIIEFTQSHLKERDEKISKGPLLQLKAPLVLEENKALWRHHFDSVSDWFDGSILSIQTRRKNGNPRQVELFAEISDASGAGRVFKAATGTVEASYRVLPKAFLAQAAKPPLDVVELRFKVKFPRGDLRDYEATTYLPVFDGNANFERKLGQNRYGYHADETTSALEIRGNSPPLSSYRAETGPHSVNERISISLRDRLLLPDLLLNTPFDQEVFPSEAFDARFPSRFRIDTSIQYRTRLARTHDDLFYPGDSARSALSERLSHFDSFRFSEYLDPFVALNTVDSLFDSQFNWREVFRALGIKRGE
jgi:hypothetical protein